MKNNKLLIFVFMSAVLLMSCEEEKTTFNGKQTLVTLNKTTIDLPVTIDATGSVEVQVDATTTSSEDRVFNIAVIDDETTANPVTFSVPSTVTIPANSYIGTFTITGEDIGVDIIPETITIEMTTDNENILIERNVGTVSIFQVCPVPDDFLVGEYALTDVSATIGPNNGFPNFPTTTVEISVGDAPTQRVFTVDMYPGIGAGRQEVVVNLICGTFDFGGPIDQVVACEGSDVNIFFDSALEGGFVNSTYDLDNIQDSYVINYAEDTEGSCSGPFLSSFGLTKI